MTPQERQLVDDLFDRLARLETAPRDADAEHAIADGLSRAPNAVYALVQTALVQDEALKRADARIRELTGEDEPAPQGGGFLDSMRDAVFGAVAALGAERAVRRAERTRSALEQRRHFQRRGGYANDPYANAPPPGFARSERRRLVPRHRRGLGRRRDRRRAAVQLHQFDVRRPSQQRQRLCRRVVRRLRLGRPRPGITAPRAAISRATPASTTSAAAAGGTGDDPTAAGLFDTATMPTIADDPGGDFDSDFGRRLRRQRQRHS